MNTLEDDKSEVDTLLRFKLEWNMIETPQKHDRFLPTNPSIPTPYFGSLAVRVMGSEGSLFREKESGDRKKMVEHLPRGEKKKKKANSGPEERGKSGRGKRMKRAVLLRQQLLFKMPLSKVLNGRLLRWCWLAPDCGGTGQLPGLNVCSWASVKGVAVAERERTAELSWVNKDKNKQTGWPAKC